MDKGSPTRQVMHFEEQINSHTRLPISAARLLPARSESPPTLRSPHPLQHRVNRFQAPMERYGLSSASHRSSRKAPRRGGSGPQERAMRAFKASSVARWERENCASVPEIRLPMPQAPL